LGLSIDKIQVFEFEIKMNALGELKVASINIFFDRKMEIKNFFIDLKKKFRPQYFSNII
jgi:hypothetical protein